MILWKYELKTTLGYENRFEVNQRKISVKSDELNVPGCVTDRWSCRATGRGESRLRPH